MKVIAVMYLYVFLSFFSVLHVSFLFCFFSIVFLCSSCFLICSLFCFPFCSFLLFFLFPVLFSTSLLIHLFSDLPCCFSAICYPLFYLFLLRYSACFSLLFYVYPICSIFVFLHLSVLYLILFCFFSSFALASFYFSHLFGNDAMILPFVIAVLFPYIFLCSSILLFFSFFSFFFFFFF